jgi:hypothetical protein
MFSLVVAIPTNRTSSHIKPSPSQRAFPPISTLVEDITGRIAISLAEMSTMQTDDTGLDGPLVIYVLGLSLRQYVEGRVVVGIAGSQRQIEKDSLGRRWPL